MPLSHRITTLALAVAGFAAHTQSYTNPVLFSDYSDPDVLRDGNTFYLVASSFEFLPGLPILSSPDLVHWSLLTHALPRLDLAPQYDLRDGNRYGHGVWAPALRKHNGLFYLYFPTPDEGIFVITAPSITGPWTKPVALITAPGLEDPCPFWDDDGSAYLIHSRKGAGPLILHRMAPDGLSLLDDGKEIVRDPVHLPNLEGPKIYKRHGFYYIFAPIAGVATGTQAVLRSRSLYGPFEQRIVLAQGNTRINGPHQGAYVETPDGHGWFLHFQSRGAHGRIVHLEPVRWQDDWPIMGDHGEPVAGGPLPVVTHPPLTRYPAASDEFSSATLGLQWEWNHNPDDAHWSLTARPGYLRLNPTVATDLYTARNTLTQQMQSQSLLFTARLDIAHLGPGTHAGLAMFEQHASGLQIVTAADGTRTLQYFTKDSTTTGPALNVKTLDLRIEVTVDTAAYSYSLDSGATFHPLGPPTPLTFSWWKGARPALFAYTTDPAQDPGYLDVDWAHVEPLPTPLRMTP